ncbi:hypothetical protein TgHK011_000967 [Trichoderma gracile]|nr:hypothetical protein TgHK011_000967 [Trichoderma gracile]
MARLKIGVLRIANPTMRTFDLEAVVIVDEFYEDLDWTSHVTVSLSYQPRLIGEATLRDTYFIPDENNEASIKFEGFNIQNMVGFKAFIQHLLPNDMDLELGIINGLTIAGRSVDEAHELSLNIELSGISKTSVDDFYIRVVEETVIVDFNLSNVNPVEIAFGFCDASVEESIVGCEPQGELDIWNLIIAGRGMRTFVFQLEGQCCPGFEIGWVNTVTTRFFYGHLEIGELTLKNTPVVPDSENCVMIPEDEECEEKVKIKSMVGFKSLFDRLMPKSGAAHWLDDDDDETKTTAAMSVSADGHHLFLSIDLAKTPRITCQVRSVTISGKLINIKLENTSSSPIDIILPEHCEFVLRQDGRTVGQLRGTFHIHSGVEYWTLSGDLEDGVSGMVLLKGVRCKEESIDVTWQQYVIRSFEAEINVDKATTMTVVKKRKLSTQSSS